jgi:ubiquinone/menaquinone biosynthesis C-methylase UbiE
MLSTARKMLGSDYDRCRLQIGSAAALPFADEKFNLTVCCRFLGLLSYPMAARVLAELHRVTRSRALLYCEVRKDVFSWPRLLDSLLALLGVPPRCFRIMGGNITEDRFLHLLAETGFSFREKWVIAETRRTRVVFYVVAKAANLPPLAEGEGKGNEPG